MPDIPAPRLIAAKDFSRLADLREHARLLCYHARGLRAVSRRLLAWRRRIAPR